MLISRDKKKKNISEYLLYMWQLEDLIRAHQFNEKSLYAFLVDPLELEDQELKVEIWEFYLEMIRSMQKQNLQEQGHLDYLKEIIKELAYLHHTLSSISNDKTYISYYKAAEPHLKLLQRKSPEKDISPVELALNGLYGLLLLRLRGREISKETEESMEKFSKMIAYLTAKYHEMKN